MLVNRRRPGIPSARMSAHGRISQLYPLILLDMIGLAYRIYNDSRENRSCHGLSIRRILSTTDHAMMVRLNERQISIGISLIVHLQEELMPPSSVMSKADRFSYLEQATNDGEDYDCGD